MKPLYKFKKKKEKQTNRKKKKISLPSLPHPSSKTRTLPRLRVEVRRTPSSPQGAHYCTFLKDPCHHNPKMKALWVYSQRRWGRQKTALIALISQDNKTISVLLLKRFRSWGFSIHPFPPPHPLYMLTLTVRRNKDRRPNFLFTVSTINSSPFSSPLNSPILLYSS